MSAFFENDARSGALSTENSLIRDGHIDTAESVYWYSQATYLVDSFLKQLY